jgi:hypothetical protein
MSKPSNSTPINTYMENGQLITVYPYIGPKFRPRDAAYQAQHVTKVGRIELEKKV